MISVIMPVRNGVPFLEAQLGALAQQAQDIAWELIVVDNGSTDATPVILEQWRDRLPLRVERAARRGINVARNVGLRNAVGDYVLFCDSDDIVDQHWLREYNKAFEAGATIVAGGVKAFAHRIDQDAAVTALFTGLGFLPFPAGANCGLKRSVVAHVGLFDESYRGGGDETDWFWRAQLAGFSLTPVPAALVYYRQRTALRETYLQSRAYGRSHVKLYAAYRQHGMAPSRGLRSAFSVLQGAVCAVLIPRRESDVRDLVARAGVLAGRLMGVLTYRRLYL